MIDVHTKAQRSRNMAAIKNSGNKSTEGAFLNLLKKKRIAGWRKHYKKVKGNPDFIFPKQKIAIFLDGCFWHGCPKCKLYPGTNKRFWNAKIKANRKRDSMVRKQLIERGWSVLRLWEHDIKNNPAGVINKIKSVV